MFALISGRVPTFMLAMLKTDYEVGIYNAAYRFFDLSAMSAVMVISPFIPIFSLKAVDDVEAVKQLSTMIAELIGILFIPIAIAAPLLSPALVSAFFGTAFLPSATVLNILAWGGILVFFSLLSSAIVLSIGVVHFGYWNTACAALVSVLLNYLWIPRYGFLGAAWATVAIEVLLAGLTMIFVFRHVGNIFRGGHWLKVGFANLVLSGLLYNPWISVALPVRIAVSLAFYAALLVFMRAVPKETMRFCREALGRKLAGSP